ncbi:hypothetical protein JTB14_024372 [Gonioctena quinquepunctata]|nr:hypothetical protein JTB14_024372 [Gonioctena quinquepunctata]
MAVSALKEELKTAVQELSGTVLLETLQVPITTLVAKLEVTENILGRETDIMLPPSQPRRDVIMIKELANTCKVSVEEFKMLKYEVETISSCPKYSVLSVIDVKNSLESLSTDIQNLENLNFETSEDISPTQIENVTSLKKHLENLSALAVNIRLALKTPDILEASSPDIKKSISAVKEDIEKFILQVLPATKIMKKLENPLKAVVGVLERVEDKMKPRRDLSLIQEIGDPISQLLKEMQLLKTKARKLSIQPQGGIMSVVDANESLVTLSMSVQNIKKIPEEYAEDISPEQFETLAALKEPLVKLTSVIVESRKALGKPKLIEKQVSKRNLPYQL